MTTKQWELGDSATHIIRLTQFANDTFGALVGDNNPVHFNNIRMAKTHYKKPIANGIQAVSAIGSAIVRLFVTGETMVIAIEQHNSFLKPIFIDDTITATVTVDEILPNDTYWLQCFVYNQNKETCISARFRVRVLHE